MSRRGAPGAAPQRAYRIVTHLLGSGRLSTMLTVVGVLVGIGWFADSLFEWLTDLGALIKGQGDAVQDWWPLHRLFAVVFLLGLLAWLWRLAGRAEECMQPLVVVDARPERAPALILYLSALKNPELERLGLVSPALASMDQFRQEFAACSWRMPLEAIAYHQPTLSRVLVISSGRSGGSRCQVRLFKSVVAQLFKDAGPRIQDIAELDHTYEPGLDFNAVDKIAAATSDAYAYLRRDGFSAKEILIDITGGSKPCSIAGGAVALAEGRRIQYVSSAYQVLAYDVTYGH